MIQLRTITILALLVICKSASVLSEIVPPLYRFDDFEKCRQVNNPGLFCYVRVVFKTDFDPIDSDRIETDFRHNLLDWGVCVSECEREVATLGEADRKRLYYPKFQINHTYIWPGEYFGRKLESLHAKYSELINICVNSRLEQNYNLTQHQHAYSEIEYCVSNDPQEVFEDFDWLTTVFLVVVAAMGGTLVLANLVDWFGVDHLQDHIVVSSFSIRRNWSSFTSESKSELHQDFRYIDGLRVLISIIIIIFHTLIALGYLPTANAEVVETLMKRPMSVTYCSIVPVVYWLYPVARNTGRAIIMTDGQRVISTYEVNKHGRMLPPPQEECNVGERARPRIQQIRTGHDTTVPLAVQTFFTISGLLLMANFLKDIERQPRFSREYFRKKIINRLIRLVPVYYFFLLITVVGHAIPGLILGFRGYMSLIVERTLCREHVWSNLFFVNNLPLTKEKCFLQGWYLGADLQLFLIALVMLALLWKYPGKAKQILWVAAVISIIIPVALIYFLKLESMIPVRLSEFKFLFADTQWMKHIYMPGYTNMNSYVGGMIVGYIYHNTKRGKLILDDSKFFKVLKHVAVSTLVLGLLTSHLFYEYEVPRSSWWIILHSVIYRNFGVIVSCICFIQFFQNPPGRLRRMLSSPLMTCLGKLSYSVYVLHVPLGRLLFNYMPSELFDSMPSALVNLAANSAYLLIGQLVLPYLVGFVVYFSIEQPMSLLLKYWFFGRRERIKGE